MTSTVVIDTNVITGALMRQDGINRLILEHCFQGQLKPLMGDALYYEYEDVMSRDYLFTNSSFNKEERTELFHAFFSICRWVAVHYRWRPNLKDEGDNHIVELARAGNAEMIVTWNARDFNRSDLIMPDLRIITPVEYLKTRKERGQ